MFNTHRNTHCQSYYDTLRRTGRTQWMIDRLVECVASGQPRSIVVGASWQHCFNELMPRIFNNLVLIVSPETKRISQNILECDGCIIQFEMIDTIYLTIQEQQRVGVFWDHYAEEVYCKTLYHNERILDALPCPTDDSGGMAYGVDKIEANMAGAEVLKGIIREYFRHQIEQFF